jgi:hypothetical protein
MHQATNALQIAISRETKQQTILNGIPTSLVPQFKSSEITDDIIQYLCFHATYITRFLLESLTASPVTGLSNVHSAAYS